jgi:thymidylate synthase ThyX
LASFTEKSQRYVTLKGDYVLPTEIVGTDLESEFKDIIELQNTYYEKLYKQAKQKLKLDDFGGSKSDLQARAKEDARYFLSLATETQMGMTINARNLERLLRRLDKTGLIEAKEIRESILTQVQHIAPSIIKYTKADDFEKKSLDYKLDKPANSKDIELLFCDEHGDEKILTSILYEASDTSWKEIYQDVTAMSPDEKREWFCKVFAGIKSYHSVPRGFENANACFEAKMSASCFAQLKRHRMSTIIRSDYEPDLGMVIPPLLEDLIDKGELVDFEKRIKGLYLKLRAVHPSLGNYILTNGHKLRVVISFNMREFYHFARLRSDLHAQWEIRELSDNIITILRDKFPLSAEMLGGKHQMI